jgi:transcriptional regulator with XRE-family HTH domain
VPEKDEIAHQLRRFGANLRRERVARSVTQERLAELADLNIRTLQKIEAGETNILITTALRLQRALGCAWTALMPAR